MIAASPLQNSCISSVNSQSGNNIGGTGITNSVSSANTMATISAVTNGISNLTTGSKANSFETQTSFSRPRLNELIREIDVTTQMDDDVEEYLLQIADDFIEDTVKSTCNFAKHRKSARVEIRDIQLHLERKWNMWIPGFGTDELRPYKRAAITEAHKQRLALIRKTIKKY